MLVTAGGPPRAARSDLLMIGPDTLWPSTLPCTDTDGTVMMGHEERRHASF